MTDLIALYWTVSGPAEVHYGREWSLWDWRDRCAQATAVGYSGLGLWHADVEHQLQTRSMREMKQIFDDAGLRHMQVEFLDSFWLPEGDPARAKSDQRRKLLFDLAAQFDAHHIKIGNIPGLPCELDRLTESYAELCADAANHTAAKVLYEFMPPDVNVHSLETAIALVTGAGAANGGLAIDTWHCGKLGIAPEDLRRIPPEYYTWVELSDGMIANMEDPIDEVVNHRKLPGEGEFDIQGYIRVSHEVGYDQPYGVEVLSAALRALPIEEAFKVSYETTMGQINAAIA
jgi:sugar phosphate isomerase/epimerase